jgi:hypothetical protein
VGFGNLEPAQSRKFLHKFINAIVLPLRRLATAANRSESISRRFPPKICAAGCDLRVFSRGRLTAEQSEKRPPGEAVDIGALRFYDRPQPTPKNYDQLLENYPASGVIQ